MFKALADFADNTAYVDPAAHDSLLSGKEKLKGRVAPLLATVSLFALSTAVAVASAGVAFTAIALGAGMAVSALTVDKMRERSFIKTAKATYDLNVASDHAAFAQHYPQHAALPGAIKQLFNDNNLSQLPVIAISTQTSHAAIADMGGVLNTRKESVFLLNEDFIKKSSPTLLLGTCAHETGHFVFGHTRTSTKIFQTAARNMNLYASIFLALSGTGIAAAATYCAASMAFNKIATAKRTQYQERQADRFSLLHTGTAFESARFYMDNAFIDNPSNAPMRAIYKTFKLFNRLAANHPPAEQRATDALNFAKKNTLHMQGVRQKFGIA